jgi:AraC-like DNA-binding protein
VLYVERKPQAELAPFVRKMWYVQDTQARHRRSHQRVLPTGRMQLILNLTERGLTDCSGAGDVEASPSLIVGLQTRWERVAEADFEDLIGVVFEPGGFAALFAEGAAVFSDRATDMEAVDRGWSRRLRERVREQDGVAARFAVVEAALRERLRGSRCALVDFALCELGRGTAVAEITRQTGLSAAAMVERFRYHVGTTLKQYARMRRFSQAVAQMHRRADVRWAELAVECGYYDQAHFCNDFKAFAGLCPTEYSSAQRPWANHIAVE